MKAICVADILIKQKLGDRQIIETRQLKHYNMVLTKPLHLEVRPRTVNMTHRKLKSVIQVGYLGSSEADLRSTSAKTT